MATALFRTVQEALTNIAKHAQATKVRVQLSCSATLCTLVVQDNGVGATPASLARKLPHALGLQGIREQVRLLHGDVSISTPRNGGFRLKAALPAPIATAGPATLGGHMIAVLLADDHTLVREGLCRLLERAGGIAVQGQASNGGEALRLLAQRPWDLLVLDMSMPGRDGVDLIRQIRRDHPAVPILVLTMHGEQQYAVQAIKAGAAYLTKDCAAAQLEQAVRKVAAGGRYLSPSIAESIAFERHGDSNAEPHLLLSDRESAVFRHLARGLKNADIGKLLCLSVKTISTYKTGSSSRCACATRPT